MSLTVSVTVGSYKVGNTPQEEDRGMTSKLAQAVQDLGLNFIGIKPGAGAEALPTDWYWVEVAKWEETASGEDGKAPGTLMYKCTLIVKSGPRQGARLFETFYMGGEMAQQNLGRMRSLAVACGVLEEDVMSPDWDPDDEWGNKNLVGQSCDGKAVYKAAKGDFDEGNSMRKYRPHEYTETDMLED